MKIDRLETHDRLEHFTSQSFDIAKTCQDIVNRRPFGDHPFYIFAHKRSLGMDERWDLFTRRMIENPNARFEEIETDRLIWQPRLTKPKAQENSMLFKAYPGTDLIRIIWMIPQRELWAQFEKGKMTENKTVWESIHSFMNNKEKLEEREEDDYSDEAINMIYCELSRKAQFEMTHTT